MSSVALQSHLTPEEHLALERKATTKSEYPDRQINTQIHAWLTPIILTFTLLLASSCSYNDLFKPASKEFQPVSEEEEERIKTELKDRSFRQFDPSKDASPGKGIILGFFDGIRLYAQYSEGRRAINEWEITAKDYRIEKASDNSEFKIYFNNPRSTQDFPTKCDNCIQTSGVSISIRNIFDSEKISFKLNDPDNSLPLPFPVFESWTKFQEDEIFD